MSRRVSLRAGLLWAMRLLVAAYTVCLLLHGDGLSQAVVDGLGLLAVWMSAGGAWPSGESGSNAGRSCSLRPR
jgi:hypothetical protein